MHTLGQYVLKFFAMMKDSFQETVDSKILYAMLVLAALVILGTASIGFETKSPEQGIDGILERFPGAKDIPFTNRKAPLRYEIKDFTQTDPQKKPWESDYHFTIVVHEQAMPGPEGQEQPVRGTFRFLVYLDDLQEAFDDPTKENLEKRQRIQQLQRNAMHGQQGKVEEVIKAMYADAQQVVTPEQMQRYIKKYLAREGSLITKSVQFVPEGADELRFDVQTEPKAGTFLTWPHKMTIGFGGYTLSDNTPVGNAVFFIEDKIIGGFGAGISMLIASIVTSFFIPNMLRKGTIDFLIAKPIPRWLLLVYKYVGGLLFMFLTTLVIVGGIWTVLGLRSGIWAPTFLLSIFVLTFQFAIFYAVSTLMGVMTRSPIVSILAACFTWLVLFSVGELHIFADATRDADLFPQWLDKTVNVTNLALPRYKDLDALSERLTAHGLISADSEQAKAIDKVYGKISWGQTVGVTLLYIAVLLAIACWWFASKDY